MLVCRPPRRMENADHVATERSWPHRCSELQRHTAALHTRHFPTLPRRVFCSKPAHISLCSHSARKADTRQQELFTACPPHREGLHTLFSVRYTDSVKQELLTTFSWMRKPAPKREGTCLKPQGWQVAEPGSNPNQSGCAGCLPPAAGPPRASGVATTHLMDLDGQTLFSSAGRFDFLRKGSFVLTRASLMFYSLSLLLHCLLELSFD